MFIALAMLFFVVGDATSASTPPPRKHWRLIPTTTRTAPGTGDLATALAAGRDGTLHATGPALWFAIELPAIRMPVMLTFTWSPPRRPRHPAVFAVEVSTRSGKGPWRRIGTGQTQGRRLEKVVVASHHNARWVRVRLEGAAARDLRDVGLYTLDSAGRNDYWLFVGASILSAAIDHRTFKDMVQRRHGHDPVVFNRAVGGWGVDDLVGALPGILADHPWARYVAIHIGGNDVSANRPYPGGAGPLARKLTAAIALVRSAGKIPVLSRLSYRAYRKRFPVPPEINGSGPYVKHVYDPLIRQSCPEFYDTRRSRGIVDAYGWFRDHPDEIGRDGIHPNRAGRRSWNRLWAEQAGAVVYGKR